MIMVRHCMCRFKIVGQIYHSRLILIISITNAISIMIARKIFILSARMWMNKSSEVLKDKLLVTVGVCLVYSLTRWFCCMHVQMKDDIEKMEDRLEWANNTLKSDWSRWQKSMRSDLKGVFIQTAEKNVEYYEKVSNLPSQRSFLKETVYKTVRKTGG